MTERKKLSESVLFARQPTPKLSYKLGREYQKGKAERYQKLRDGQRSRAENTAAKIYEYELCYADRAHNEYKRAIFRKSRK